MITIVIFFFFTVVLLVFVIYNLSHLIREVRRGLVRNMPRILLGGFFTGCVGAAILAGVFDRYYRFFLSGFSGGGTGCAPGEAAFIIGIGQTLMGIIGFFLGFLLGTWYLRRKFKRK